MSIKDFLKKWFCSNIQLTEDEELFQKMMREIVECGNTYYDICDNELPNRTHICCDRRYYNIIEFFHKKKLHLRQCSFYDEAHNLDIVLYDVYVDEHYTFMSQHIFIIRYKRKTMTYSSHKIETYKLAFPDGYPIHSERYLKYEPDLKKYGFWLECKDGKMLLRHPREKVLDKEDKE